MNDCTLTNVPYSYTDVSVIFCYNAGVFSGGAEPICKNRKPNAPIYCQHGNTTGMHLKVSPVFCVFEFVCICVRHLMQEIIVDNTVFVIAPYGRIYALQM